MLSSQLSMRVTILSYSAGLCLILGILMGCGEDPQQLFETAQFEEEQGNVTHAKELYDRILRDHGSSPTAKKAEERLKELTKENR